MHEHLDFSYSADILCKSGGRALGAIISKIQNHKDIGFKTYTKMYYSCVVPVTDYCSSIWGFKNYKKLDITQHRAIRYFMGVHRFAPILAITGDMGWICAQHRRWVNVLRLWNRLVHMGDDRLTKKVFLYDYTTVGNTWCSDVKHILQQVNMSHLYDNKLPVDLKNIEDSLLLLYKSNWSDNVTNVAKLRTYVTFKQDYETEKYLMSSLTKAERSHLAQLRCGILPLKLETGRYVGLRVDERICTLCTDNVVEDETHFILKCSRYNDLRVNLISKCKESSSDFDNMSDIQKLSYVIQNQYVSAAKFIVESMKRRRLYLYK
jgi:hypothetical protein